MTALTGLVADKDITLANFPSVFSSLGDENLPMTAYRQSADDECIPLQTSHIKSASSRTIGKVMYVKIFGLALIISATGAIWIQAAVKSGSPFK